MQRFITLLLILFLTIPLKANQQDIKGAADLYFNFKQEEALEKFIKISKETGDRDSFLNAVYIALELGETRLAVDTVSIALKKFPLDSEVLEFAGEAYLAAGYYLNAENVFARLNENNNKTAFYYISLARAQMGMGQYDLAEINLKQAAAGDQHTALANFMLGELYSQKKQYRKAADHYKKVIKYDSQFIEAKERYGDMMVKLKRYKEAYSNYSSVQAADSSDDKVKESLEKLKDFAPKEHINILSIPETPKAHTIVKKPASFHGNIPEIRVGLGAKINGAPAPVKRVQFSTSHRFRAENKNGKVIKRGTNNKFWTVEIINGKAYLISPSGQKTAFQGDRIKIMQDSTNEAGHTTILKNMLVGHGTTWAGRETKEYRGYIEFVYNKSINGFIIINHVNIEEYVFGVIASEMPSTFPIEALKVQAVIARTYAIKALGKHKRWGYDVCDTQNCQVYGGVKAERERTNAAVEATMGKVITYKGKPIEAVFSSNCGGYTQSSKEAGWFPHDYLQPVSDYKDFNEDNLQPYHFKELLQQPHQAYSRYFNNVSPAAFRWTRYIDESRLRIIINRKKKIGSIKAIVPLNRGRSGYVNGVKIIGTKGTLTLTKEHEIKKYLALGLLRSTYFMVQPNYEKGKVKSFIFYGGGWGHGVGLCQTGSGGRAEAGQDYEQILKHYYTGTELKDIRQK